MANMYTRDWVENIEPVTSQESVGWEVTDGGYAVVNLLDTRLEHVMSFADSPAREEMQERVDYTSYPDGHWLFFPYNTVTVAGDGEFNLSLTLSAKPIETFVLERPSNPLTWRLYQNFPNPFNPETKIRFQLPENSQIELRIFNTLGQEIRTLINTKYEAGSYEVRWDGKDKNGNYVSSGVYLYQLKARNFGQVQKMLLLR